MSNSGAVIVSWDFSRGKDVGVLVVGKKLPGRKDAEIINAYQGEEAEMIYRWLTVRGGVKRDSVERKE